MLCIPHICVRILMMEFGRLVFCEEMFYSLILFTIKDWLSNYVHEENSTLDILNLSNEWV